VPWSTALNGTGALDSGVQTQSFRRYSNLQVQDDLGKTIFVKCITFGIIFVGIEVKVIIWLTTSRRVDGDVSLEGFQVKTSTCCLFTQ